MKKESYLRWNRKYTEKYFNETKKFQKWLKNIFKKKLKTLLYIQILKTDGLSIKKIILYRSFAKNLMILFETLF
jgi:hypothetical protein